MAISNFIVTLSPAFEQCTLDSFTTGSAGQAYVHGGNNIFTWVPEDGEWHVYSGVNSFALYIRIKSSYTDIYVYYNNNQLCGVSTINKSQATIFKVAIGVDENSQLGYVYGVYLLNNGSRFTVIDMSTNANRSTLYTAITGAIPIVYTWTSVPAISGKEGTFNLTCVKDEFITDAGGSDRPLTDISVFAGSSDIKNFIQNYPYGSERVWMFSGELNMLTCTKNVTSVPLVGDVDNFTLKFYIGGSLVKTVGPILINSGSDYFLGMYIDEENEVAAYSIIQRHEGLVDYTGAAADSDLYTWVHAGTAEESDDSLDNLNNEDSGGDEWNPLQDVPISGPSAPTLGAVNTGFTQMYKMELADLQSLSAFLWTDDFVENVKKFFNDPAQAIVGLTIMPVAPDAASGKTEIKAGRISTGVQGYLLNKQYVKVDMGSYKFNPESNTFLDWPPYKKASVYLPYCGGDHSLDVNDVMTKTLSLEYWFDMLTGSVAALLAVNGSYKYCFLGQCGVQLPISAEDFSRMYSAIISTAASAASTIATGGAGAIVAISGLAQNIMNMHPDVQYSNGSGASGEFISLQQPYIKIEAPNPLLANKTEDNAGTIETFRQRSFLGKTTFQNLKLQNCSGFTKVIKAHLNNLTCLDNELLEIENNLQQGVIIQTGSATPSSTPTTTGSVVIVFLKNLSAHEVIGKKFDTDHELSLEGKLLYNQSLTAPKILIDGDIRGYNYCYIGEFNRFYYITDNIIQTGTIQELSLKCDVLQSFKDEILSCRAIVERQENKGNLLMVDDKMWTQNNKRVITQPFMGGDSAYRNASGEQCFVRSNNNYILTVAGG